MQSLPFKDKHFALFFECLTEFFKFWLVVYRLIHKFLDVKSLNAVKSPSARIHVVKPFSLCIRISGDLWYLEIGHEYDISLVVTDADSNTIYIPEVAYQSCILPCKVLFLTSSFYIYLLVIYLTECHFRKYYF